VVAGAGPAGASAAIAAALAGARVRLYDHSRFPRHKVCGEFLSPGIVGELQRLGVFDQFLARLPAPIRRVSLWFGSRQSSARLPGEAFGLSRYAFDELLVVHARTLGAVVLRERLESAPEPVVLAHGRDSRNSPPRDRRLFGFKAHFDGPAGDAIELYFSHHTYVGVSPVESGRTNVCGLAPEWRLRQSGFEFDEILHSIPPLRERLQPLRRAMKWLAAGPLVFGNRLRRRPAQHAYPAGDALSFVDPFTGSGILAAVTTGALAGASAASGMPPGEYLRICRARLSAPFRISSVFRTILRLGWADRLGPLVPPEVLFQLTRPLLAPNENG
jgi:hypothetical protein